MADLRMMALAALEPADVVKLALRSKGLTLAQVAKESRISAGWLSKYLHGHAHGAGDSARDALARALEVEPAAVAQLVEHSP